MIKIDQTNEYSVDIFINFKYLPFYFYSENKKNCCKNKYKKIMKHQAFLLLFMLCKISPRKNWYALLKPSTKLRVNTGALYY